MKAPLIAPDGSGDGRGAGLYSISERNFIRAFTNVFCYYRPHGFIIPKAAVVYNINGSGHGDGEGLGFEATHNDSDVTTFGFDIILDRHRIKPIEVELDEAYD